MKNRRFVASLLVALLPGIVSAQQEPAAMSPQEQQSASTAGSAHLEQRLDQVLAALNGMQHQLDDSKQQIDQLHHELEEVRAQLAAANAQTPAATAEAASQLQNSVQQLQDQGEILQAEVKQHDQTKVESASKYPVKINGLLLFSSFLNDGAVDNIDLPIVALPRTPRSLTEVSEQRCARRSLVWKRKGPPSGTHAPPAIFTWTSLAEYLTRTTPPLRARLRLRTAHARLDWANHSLIAALDAPLVSPLEPTSYVGLGEPPFAWSGNLWIWLPQVESLNRTRLGAGTLGFDFSLVDPAAPGNPATSGERQPDRSRAQPPAWL